MSGSRPLFRPLFGGTQPQATGPGSQTPIVDGFYGEVSAQELYTGDELALMLGVTEGSPINSNGGWLKFSHNDNILFIAKQPFRHSITWQHLYERGIVYGTDDTGKAPYGTPTNQLTKVRKNGNDFVVRLMTGANADPFAESDPLFFTADMYQQNVGGGSEWNDLIYRIHQAVPSDPAADGMQADRHGGPQVGPNWASYTDGDIGIASGVARASWAQEQSDVTSARRARRGSGGLAGFGRGAAAVVGSGIGWRPVLQLIPNN